MPAAEFAQKKVRVVARIADVVHDDRTADLASVIHDEIAKTEKALWNGGRDGYILHFAQGNVSGGASDQAGVDLEFRVGHCVANHVAPNVVITGNQQQSERERD